MHTRSGNEQGDLGRILQIHRHLLSDLSGVGSVILALALDSEPTRSNEVPTMRGRGQSHLLTEVRQRRRGRATDVRQGRRMLRRSTDKMAPKMTFDALTPDIWPGGIPRTVLLRFRVDHWSGKDSLASKNDGRILDFY